MSRRHSQRPKEPPLLTPLGPVAPAVTCVQPARPHPVSPKEERRLVSVLFAGLAAPIGIGRRLDPEDLRDVVGGALAGVIAEVEALGGMVTSVSGAGLVALFGAPEAHEDDPERSVRAGFRVLAAIAGRDNTPWYGAAFRTHRDRDRARRWWGRS